MIVAPAHVRPGDVTNVRIADAQRRGGLSATVCARSAAATTPCRGVRLRAGTAKTRLRVRLPRAGRWTITVRSGSGERLARGVDVRATARYRVLVAGDSMVYGIIDVLGRSVRATGGTLRGDPNPGSGITKPALVDWPAHARRSAGRLRPDATVVFLGAADRRLPGHDAVGRDRAVLRTGLGRGVRPPRARGDDRVSAQRAQASSTGSCCRRRAIRRASSRSMRSTPRSRPPRARSPTASRSSTSRRVISPGDRYVDEITYGGKRVVVRETDGMHLANAGVHIATNIILRAMRRDGIARR